VRYVDLDTVMKDLAQRPVDDIYLTDLDFSMTPVDRVKEFNRRLLDAGMRKTFTIESRVDTITEEMADAWRELGINRVKLGVEGGTDAMMKSFAKGTTISQARDAVNYLHQRDIGVVVYLVVGGKAPTEEYEHTRTFVRELNPEFVAVNTWAYDFRTDYRYDSQFSPASLAHWDTDPSEFFKHMELQAEVNPTVGKILDVL
jgi:radical SAM superfamily enzyme YgiQ (UPF0313 family)